MKADFFIDRPVFSAVLSIVIVILGIIGLTMLPVDQYPQITPPVVKISASYPGASAQTVEEALRQKTELARTREIETTVETLLAARGFDQTLCTVRQGSVNIVVRAQSLTQQQAAQILDIAVSESGEPAANVRIVPAQ